MTMTTDQLSSITGSSVDAATLARLETFTRLVERWNSKINLIAPGTLASIWPRHVADSAQIFPLLPSAAASLVDLGSGGGFPGVVLSTLLEGAGRPTTVHLIESDKRKSVFLSSVLRDLGLSAIVHAARAEHVEPLQADVVTARALAPLDRLAPLAARHLAPGGVGIFPKGENYHGEIESLGAEHRVLGVFPSRTNLQSAIIMISSADYRRVA